MSIRDAIYNIVNFVTLRNDKLIKVVAENLVIVIGFGQFSKLPLCNLHSLALAILHGHIVGLDIDQPFPHS